ncbi:acetylornithine deacetylase [Larsenimonas rhizosphaerae]|uniref:Acetylornithine deacetylase n=1 Tax=Larsenimonas rhizosphaerae TaxID=2944682 RepID=A0AA41ZN87_9GAMM|nr:acetylornithine deacetylase [Larsenimonas rhizosphaerae]MCX2525386.1 acetylornithine deacetylase [Larsenimonas rhizosphaerae]
MPSTTDAVDLLTTLVGFDTTSHRSNLELIAFIECYLDDHGVASRRVLDTTGEKANLFATIGPQDRGGVILSGHTDVVPVTGQTWHTDPFTLTAQEGRLYGRGAADMKGFLAAVLATVPAMTRARLGVPIHLAFSHDEEVGCVGVRSLIDDLKGVAHRPVACIVGEPTRMRVATAHKGKLAIRVSVTGKASHSGMAPEGVNAIHAAGHLIQWVDTQARAKAEHGPFDERFSVPWTTLQVGVVQGGEALNIVPATCHLDIEMRTVPEDDPEALLEALTAVARTVEADMRAHHDEARIEVTRLGDYPGLSVEETSPLLAFTLGLIEDQDRARIGYGTEAGLFQNGLDIPTLVCGPGDMAQGHTPDEFIETDQLHQCVAWLHEMVDALTTDAIDSSHGGRAPFIAASRPGR